MRIDIFKIIKVNGASLDIEFNETLEDIISEDSGFVFNSPVSFKGKLTNISGILKLEGHLKAEYTVRCYRCLKEMDKKVEFDVMENFMGIDKEPDDEAYTYEGNYIVIDKALKDNIILNLPMKQVCEESCRGFCPKCGEDLNAKTCDCKEDNINPQMEALKNFFNN